MTLNGKFYVTTPIYYVNDKPHIGHAYTTIASDILARYNRLLGRDVFFLTGTDEHGQKVDKAAQQIGMTPKEHADSMVNNFKNLWKKLNISNDAFIRTTDSEHIKVVQENLQLLFDNGEIKKRSYSGWYCVPDERFWTDKDLVGCNCPDCGRPVENIYEENYFFLMSKYQQRLIDYIEKNPDYILPETRRNEVLGFLKNKELGDLCISRPKSRLSWGIPLPFDDNFVTYVWFDALINYFSATKYLIPENLKSAYWWPADHHIIGKDILTTHAIYWSIILMSLGIPLPRNIFAHGWWTIEGKKMSKSVGNIIDPVEIVDKYSVDAFRYFLFREVTFGLDGDFSEGALIRRINTDLANDLGNLLSRFATMAEKYFKGVIEMPFLHSEFAEQCVSAILNIHKEEYWSRLHFNQILDHIWNIISAANNYIARKEPWKLSKDNPDELKLVMSDLWNVLKAAAVSLYPFMPETSEKIWRQIGLRSLQEEAKQSMQMLHKEQYPEIFYWRWVPAYEIKVSKGELLFPKIEKEEKKKQNIKDTKEKSCMIEENATNLIGIEDFAKVVLKVGKVISAEKVEKSEKLIRLKVDIGEERQIVAGIGRFYEPDYLIGKKIVVVTNLKPAKLMGIESHGMLLAATDDEGQLSIVILDRDVNHGARVK